MNMYEEKHCKCEKKHCNKCEIEKKIKEGICDIKEGLRDIEEALEELCKCESCK